MSLSAHPQADESLEVHVFVAQYAEGMEKYGYAVPEQTVARFSHRLLHVSPALHISRREQHSWYIYFPRSKKESSEQASVESTHVSLLTTVNSTLSKEKELAEGPEAI